MRVAVVGAGLAGLNAARMLSEYCKVDVYEAGEVGGLAGSYCAGRYCIEAFYHHFFRGDEYLLSLIDELGLGGKVVWRVAKVGQEFQGRIYPLNTPVEILAYPGMSLLDKVRLTAFTLKARRKRFEEYDDVGVLDGLRGDAGERLIERFFMPLLRSKFGDNFERVSYAWLLARVSLRSNRKLSGEELGYLRGGMYQLVEKLSEGLNVVRERAAVKKTSRWSVNGREYDAVIYTAPLPELGELAKTLGIAEVEYQSSICLLLGMDESFTDSLYWVNYSSAPFGATIEHTNFMPLEDYGERLMYVASYTTPDRVLEMSDEEVFRTYTRHLERYGLDAEGIRWWKVFRAKYSGPVYERGFRRKITPYRVAEGFYVAGMTSEANYPERSMNGSLLAGKKAAEQLISDLLS
ncbi:Protoporphyrinogen oxidase [Geoglobus ahangari]|uniref:Protoporphyrinogen oxidase n=1 Tax=Geoglobus ahangari TaxID=113653 RepID=A0A0F7IGF9_9EURY|nr:NAD(P)/FAD-dependent oxidoreductase [Geoglobus ahangari]AKG91000.1 Protoporphyrinogen oxidase [Geoglobus ahangari]